MLIKLLSTNTIDYNSIRNNDVATPFFSLSSSLYECYMSSCSYIDVFASVSFSVCSLSLALLCVFPYQS